MPCGSSSRGCVRGCWPDPEEQRRRFIFSFHCLYPIRENTIFFQSDATATTACISVVTIQWWLLFEGGYYSRVVSI